MRSARRFRGSSVYFSAAQLFPVNYLDLNRREEEEGGRSSLDSRIPQNHTPSRLMKHRSPMALSLTIRVHILQLPLLPSSIMH